MLKIFFDKKIRFVILQKKRYNKKMKYFNSEISFEDLLIRGLSLIGLILLLMNFIRD